MLHQNINSIAAASTTHGYAYEFAPTIPIEVPCKEVVEIRGIVAPKKTNVDPLAYYVALVLVGGMDELVTGGGYCQVDGRRYCDLAETIRAWDKFETELEG